MPDRRYPRVARVNVLVREVLADELERMEDDRFGFLTVTGVDVTGDLRHATVYYSVLGQQDRQETADALKSVTPHLKGALSRQVRLKYLPDLVFREDPAVATGERVEQIIREIHAVPKPAAGPNAAAAGVDTASEAGP